MDLVLTNFVAYICHSHGLPCSSIVINIKKKSKLDGQLQFNNKTFAQEMCRQSWMEIGILVLDSLQWILDELKQATT